MDLRLKELMKEKGVTNLELSKKCGITHITISKMANGKTPISVERLEEFANILDVEFWELFYTKEQILNTISETNVGNDVSCPYCGKKLVLCIK